MDQPTGTLLEPSKPTTTPHMPISSKNAGSTTATPMEPTPSTSNRSHEVLDDPALSPNAIRRKPESVPPPVLNPSKPSLKETGVQREILVGLPQQRRRKAMQNVWCPLGR